MPTKRIRLGIFVPYFCHPSETFILDSTRLDPKRFDVEVVTFEVSPFAKKNCKVKINRIPRNQIHKTFINFDLIHVHYLNNLRNLSIEILKHHRIYVTCHGEDVFLYGRDSLYRWQLKEKLPHVEKFLCVSKNLSTALQKYFKVPATQIEITPLGIDLKKFPFKFKSQTSKVWQLGVAARLVDYKGIDDLIRAGAILKSQNISFQIHIIGSGPQEKKLKRLAEKLELQKEIQWHGWLKGSELISALRKLDAYVGPYKTGRGGAQDSMTMILKEAMALGIPVVSTTNSAIPELIQSGKHGILVPPANPQKLAQAIQKTMQQRKKLVLQARKHTEKNFDLKNQTQRWLEIISSNS